MVAAHEFSFAGATLIAERRGSGRAVFLLVHGLGMGRSVFGDLATRLQHAGRVIAVDLPGYGEAPEPERVLTVERTADLLAAFLRSRVGAPAIVVGHSMGAQIAVEMAARHPESVERLVLIGPSTDPRARSAHRQFARLARDLFVESPRVFLVGGREYLRAGPRRIAKLRAMLRHRPEEVFGDVSVPTLIVRGGNDYVAPARWCLEIAAGIADAQVVEIAGHGHETMIRDAAPAAELILAFVQES